MAIQLFDSFSFIRFGVRVGEKDHGEPFAELFFGEVALQPAVLADGDAARFLADDDRHGIGALGEADGGAVAEAGGAILHFPFRDGKHTGGAGHAVFGDDHAAVVEGGFRKKNAHRQLGGELGVEHDTCLELLLERDVALDREECADAFFRKHDHGIREALHEGEAAFTGEDEDAAATEAGEAVAQLWLENDKQREGEDSCRTGDDPSDYLEIKQLCNESESDEDEAQADKDLRPARGTKSFVELINTERQHENLNPVSPMFSNERPHILREN